MVGRVQPSVDEFVSRSLGSDVSAVSSFNFRRMPGPHQDQGPRPARGHPFPVFAPTRSFAEFGGDPLSSMAFLRLKSPSYGSSEMERPRHLNRGLQRLLEREKKNSFVERFRAGPLSEKLLEEPVLFLRVHRESALVAVALEDYTVVVLDLDTRLTVRRFASHHSQLTDMAFSPDARWLVAASMDCTICTWDIPSAHLVDIFKVDVPCTSLTFSPTGDRLATAHVNCLGIYLWSNRSIFEHVSLCPVKRPVDIPTISLPTTLPGEALTDTIQIEDEIKTTASCEQISEELATLSLVSQSRWQNLLNIDVIWKKNKPKHLLKKPQVAPFFLPTIPSLDFQFDLNKESSKKNEGNVNLMELNHSTVFRTLLNEAVTANDFLKAMQKLKESSLSTINYEITALSSEGTESYQVFIQYIKMIDTMLQKKRDFEVTQAYMALFLKTHGNTVASQSEIHKKLESLDTLQETSWHVLQDKLMFCLCIVESLKCF